MTKKYKYEVEEYSQDTRSFFVESDIELTHDEIKGHKVYTQYTGTDFGDDCQTNILELK